MSIDILPNNDEINSRLPGLDLQNVMVHHGPSGPLRGEFRRVLHRYHRCIPMTAVYQASYKLENRPYCFFQHVLIGSHVSSLPVWESHAWRSFIPLVLLRSVIHDRECVYMRFKSLLRRLEEQLRNRDIAEKDYFWSTTDAVGMPLDQSLFEFRKKASRLRYRTCSAMDVSKATSSAVDVRIAQLVQVLNSEGMGLTDLTISEMGSVYVSFGDDADVGARHVGYPTNPNLDSPLQHFKKNMRYSALPTRPDEIEIRVRAWDWSKVIWKEDSQIELTAVSVVILPYKVLPMKENLEHAILSSRMMNRVLCRTRYSKQVHYRQVSGMVLIARSTQRRPTIEEMQETSKTIFPTKNHTTNFQIPSATS